MRRALRFVPVAVLAALTLAGAAALAPQGAESRGPVKNEILAHKLAVELGQEPRRGKEMPVSGGVMYALYERTGVLSQRAAQNPRAMERLQPMHGGQGISRPFTEGCQKVFRRHGMTNTRVNQDCSFRRLDACTSLTIVATPNAAAACAGLSRCSDAWRWYSRVASAAIGLFRYTGRSGMRRACFS